MDIFLLSPPTCGLAMLQSFTKHAPPTQVRFLGLILRKVVFSRSVRIVERCPRVVKLLSSPEAILLEGVSVLVVSSEMSMAGGCLEEGRRAVLGGPVEVVRTAGVRRGTSAEKRSELASCSFLLGETGADETWQFMCGKKELAVALLGDLLHSSASVQPSRYSQSRTFLSRQVRLDCSRRSRMRRVADMDEVKIIVVICEEIIQMGLLLLSRAVHLAIVQDFGGAEEVARGDQMDADILIQNSGYRGIKIIS